MAYDEALAARIRDQLEGEPGLIERKMFGGIGWTINGNMAAGAHSDGRLMIRCSKGDFATLLTEAGANGMTRGTTLLTGWVLVDADAVASDEGVELWVGRGRDYAAGLPAKVKKAKKPKKG